MSEFAGSLTERIEFWQRSPARLPSGASSEGLSFRFSCLAAVTADGVGQASEAMAVSAMPRFRFTVRVGAELAIDQQVRWRGKRLLIRQIVDDPQLPDRLVLRCEEQRS